MINALLNAAAVPPPTELSLLRSALELAAAAVARAFAPTLRSEPLRPSLSQQAEEAIRAKASDPDFSVDELARMLSVTRRHLTRALTAEGDPPRARLRRARLALAETALTVTGPDGLRDDDLARLCGFRSARAMRENLREATQEHDVAGAPLVRSLPRAP